MRNAVRNAALAFACLACAGQARRVHGSASAEFSVDDMPPTAQLFTEVSANAKGDLRRTLADLILTSSAAAAFNPSGLRFAPRIAQSTAGDLSAVSNLVQAGRHRWMSDRGRRHIDALMSQDPLDRLQRDLSSYQGPRSPKNVQQFLLRVLRPKVAAEREVKSEMAEMVAAAEEKWAAQQAKKEAELAAQKKEQEAREAEELRKKEEHEKKLAKLKAQQAKIDEEYKKEKEQERIKEEEEARLAESKRLKEEALAAAQALAAKPQSTGETDDVVVEEPEAPFERVKPATEESVRDLIYDMIETGMEPRIAHFKDAGKSRAEALQESIAELEATLQKPTPEALKDQLLGHWKLLATSSQRRSKVGATGTGPYPESAFELLAEFQHFDTVDDSDELKLQVIDFKKNTANKFDGPKRWIYDGNFGVGTLDGTDETRVTENYNELDRQTKRERSPMSLSWSPLYLSPELRINRELDGTICIYEKTSEKDFKEDLADLSEEPAVTEEKRLYLQLEDQEYTLDTDAD